MPSFKRSCPLACAAVLAALGASPALAPAKSSSSASPPPLANARALLASRELWATIDVCNPTDQPDTVGIRGSMPGDAHAGDRMYMSFRLQYMGSAGHWVDVASAVPGFGAVGSAAAAREGGASFQLVPVAGKPPSQLRGIVSFQWRRAGRVLLSSSRPSGAGHASVAGADPVGYSAATCQIG